MSQCVTWVHGFASTGTWAVSLSEQRVVITHTQTEDICLSAPRNSDLNKFAWKVLPEDGPSDRTAAQACYRTK